MMLDKMRGAAPLDRQPVHIRIGPAMLLAVLLILGIFLGMDAKTAFSYHRAEQMALAGEYIEASQQFGKLAAKHYKDSEAWQYYCRAQINLANGQPGEARRLMDKAFFHHLDEEEKAVIEDFRKNLSTPDK